MNNQVYYLSQMQSVAVNDQSPVLHQFEQQLARQHRSDNTVSLASPIKPSQMGTRGSKANFTETKKSAMQSLQYNQPQSTVRISTH